MTLIQEASPICVVIVGHVDHGKSTFIGRFLFDSGNLNQDKMADIKDFAHVMDQFREEREQNKTIDTAQTFFRLDDKPYVFIDAPGHKEYLKHMITGATQASFAFLLLDINEGIKEQTEKHIQVLRYLGLSHLVVLINKMDQVSFSLERFEKSKKEIEKSLLKHHLTADHIIPISAKEGDNLVLKSKSLGWYKGPTVKDVLIKLNNAVHPKPNGTPTSFPVQLVFSVDDVSYVLGRVEEGLVQKGMVMSLFPTDEKITIQKISKYKQMLTEAKEGDSVALELSSIKNVKRGMILTTTHTINLKNKFVAHTLWISDNPLSRDMEVEVECRTQRVTSIVKQVEDEFEKKSLTELHSGDIAKVQFETKAPIYLDFKGAQHPFSRVVFYKNGEVAGCGVVAETI